MVNVKCRRMLYQLFSAFNLSLLLLYLPFLFNSLLLSSLRQNSLWKVAVYLYYSLQCCFLYTECRFVEMDLVVTAIMSFLTSVAFATPMDFNVMDSEWVKPVYHGDPQRGHIVFSVLALVMFSGLSGMLGMYISASLLFYLSNYRHTLYRC